MKRLVLAAALAVAGLVGLAGSSSAAGACADVYVNINGEVVEQQVCTPELPAPPALP